jgi:hypothetical protein
MSHVTRLSPDKDKKRPSVSSKCLLNIKSIVAHNVSSNTTNKNACLRSSTSTLPPLPLIDLSIIPKENINHFDDRKDIEEKKRKKSQSFPNRNVLTEYLQKTDLKKTSNKHSNTTKYGLILRSFSI